MTSKGRTSSDGDGSNQDPNRYTPSDIEKKWQAKWETDGIYEAADHVEGKENFFALVMFPYPSGDIHMGHWFQYTGADAYARFKRMQGYNVLHPQGFDSFGLPAENAAIERGEDPREWTYANIDTARRQFREMGASYDWSRELVTSDPEYYKWNQYFFLQFYKNGLAYRKHGPANWCPKDQTTLANEQVRDGACERCGTTVIKRALPQWYFAITKYAEELLEFDQLDWPEKIKTMQRNWIGRSTGTTIGFDVSEFAPGEKIETFTTRIDTVYGVTFVVLAPEHPLVEKLTQPAQKAAVEAYVEKAARETEIERTSTEREKTGIETGAYCINPLNGERVPVLVGDYVLATYGTGAVMGVPAHDTRDFVFAKKYGLEIRVVVAPPGWDGGELQEAWIPPGTQVNSSEFDGLPSTEGMGAIAEKIEANGWGERTITYHLRDWLISRQRYWGTPIPIIYCDDCGTVPVPEQDLPVLLPDRVKFEADGVSPLTKDKSFLNTTCPDCGKAAKRETDTLDTFVCSAWYHLRFASPSPGEDPFDTDQVRAWVPVRSYIGGAEHAVMHLLYSRFFSKALRDTGFVDFDEPYTKLTNQGMLIKDGRKISKRSNPLPPDPVVAMHGADTLRCYLMFLGPWDQGGDWSDSGINGIKRWLGRVWDVAQRDEKLLGPEGETAAERELTRAAHVTTMRVLTDMDAFKFNTSISALMEYTTELLRQHDKGNVSAASWRAGVDRLLLHTAPLAPHIAEELWERTGHSGSIHLERNPEFDESLTATDMITLAVQVNGKVRDQIEVAADIDQAGAIAAAKASENVARHLAGTAEVKSIYVLGRLVNLVVRPAG
ncbi:MAG: leucine--tRNA ligase [Chloroflexi bacterium]|nr:leucine--tRNA ligase [Chloroflexota bacterium]